MEDDKIQWLVKCHRTIYFSLIQIYRIKCFSEMTNTKRLCLEEQTWKGDKLLPDLMEHPMTYYEEIKRQLDTCNANGDLEHVILKTEQMLKDIKTDVKFYKENMVSKGNFCMFLWQQILDELQLCINDIAIPKAGLEHKVESTRIKCLDMGHRLIEKEKMRLKTFELTKQLLRLDCDNYSLDLQLDDIFIYLKQHLLEKDKLLADLEHKVEEVMHKMKVKDNKCLDLEGKLLKKGFLEKQLKSMRIECFNAEQQLRETENMLDDLKKQEESHLHKMVVKDKECSDLKQQLLEKDKMLADLEQKMEEVMHKMEIKEYKCMDMERELLKKKLSIIVESTRIKCLNMEQQLGEKENMRLQLHNHLTNQEESHLHQMEVKDKECSDLKQQLLEKDKLIADLEQKVEELVHKMEVEDNKRLDLERKLLKKDIMLSSLQKQVELTTIKCWNLKQQLGEIENMRLQLLNDLKNQEESHFHKMEVNYNECSDLKQQLLEKDNLLADLEQKVEEVVHKMEVKDNECSALKQELLTKTEFVNVQKIQIEDYQQQSLEYERTRLQLLNDLKQQEETYLHEFEARDRKVSELQQEIDIKKMNMYLQVSCSICLEERNTDDHRLVSLQCGHTFGDKCIQDCIQRYSKCPVCSSPAALNDRRNIYCN